MSTMTLSAPIAAPRAARACGGSHVGARRGTAAPGRAASGRVVSPVGGRRASLRLTRRGRLTVFVLALVMCAVASLAISSSGSASNTAQRAPVEYVTVLPGDSLWNIANDVAPSADPRDTVAAIIELNALDDSSVRAGQRLAVPAQK